MVNIEQAKLYCKEDISLIENYEKAKKDLLEMWDIHHRKEEEGYSYKELKKLGLYYKRPASELKFLTKKEHISLHKKGNKYWLGKHHSDEAKKKISEAKKGKYTGEKHPNSKPVNQIDKQTGQIIKTWTCAAEVERVLGIAHQDIPKCCSGKIKSRGGYVWRYADI